MPATSGMSLPRQPVGSVRDEDGKAGQGRDDARLASGRHRCGNQQGGDGQVHDPPSARRGLGTGDERKGQRESEHRRVLDRAPCRAVDAHSADRVTLVEVWRLDDAGERKVARPVVERVVAEPVLEKRADRRNARESEHQHHEPGHFAGADDRGDEDEEEDEGDEQPELLHRQRELADVGEGIVELSSCPYRCDEKEADGC